MSARDATESVLARLNAINPTVNAVAETLEAEARAAADEADRAVAGGGQLGPLCRVAGVSRRTLRRYELVVECEKAAEAARLLSLHDGHGRV